MKKVQLVFLLVAALVVSACTKDEVGQLAYSVSLDRVGDAETVTITVGDSGIEVTADVTQVTELSGVLDDVPAGTYLVVAAAYAAGASQASAEASASVSIAEDAAAVVALILGSDTIGSIVASNTTPHVGEVITLTAELDDGSTPDLIWSDDCSGDFQQNVSAEVSWSAAEAGDCNVSVQIASSAVSAATIELNVGLAPGTQILLAGTGQCIGHGNGEYDDGATRVTYEVWNRNGYYIEETGRDATSVGFDRVYGLDLDSKGRVIFADRNGGRIFRVENDATLTRLGGDIAPQENGGVSSGPATLDTNLYWPFHIDVSVATDDIYIAEAWNGGRIKRINADDGTIETIVSNGSCCTPYAGSGADPLSIQTGYYVTSLAIDETAGDLYFGNTYWSSDWRRKYWVLYSEGNTVHTILDGDIEMEPEFWDIQLSGDSLIASERFHHRIIKMNKDGTNQVVLAGEMDRPGFDGDGGQGIRALVNNPRGLFVDSKGVVYFSDSGNGRIRKVDADGIVSTVVEGVNAADLVMDSSRNIVMTGVDTCSVHKVIGPF